MTKAEEAIIKAALEVVEEQKDGSFARLIDAVRKYRRTISSSS